MKWLLSQEWAPVPVPSRVTRGLQKDVLQRAVRDAPPPAEGKSVLSFSSPAFFKPGASNIVLLLLTEGKSGFVPCPLSVPSLCARALVPCPSPRRGQGSTYSDCHV